MNLEMLELLYSGSNSQYGVIVETSNAENLRHKLYALRRKHIEQFEHLSFVISPVNGADLWILNKEQASAKE